MVSPVTSYWSPSHPELQSRLLLLSSKRAVPDHEEEACGDRRAGPRGSAGQGLSLRH